MLLEGIVGFAVIIAIAIFVTKFVLEAMHLPVQSEAEWEKVAPSATHNVEGSPIKCGTPLYFTEYPGGKVVRTEVVLCHACHEAIQAMEEATKP